MNKNNEEIIIDGVDVSGCERHCSDNRNNPNMCYSEMTRTYSNCNPKEKQCNFYITFIEQQLKRKEKEHQETQKALAKCWIENGRLKKECEELKDKLNCCFCNPHVELNDFEKQRKCIEVTECFRRQLDKLKAENERLQEEREKAKNYNLEYGQLLIKATNKNNKLKQTLAEIKPILEYYENSKIGEKQEDGSYKLEFKFSDVATPYCINYDPKPAREALQKISEVLEQ